MSERWRVILDTDETIEVAVTDETPPGNEATWFVAAAGTHSGACDTPRLAIVSLAYNRDWNVREILAPSEKSRGELADVNTKLREMIEALAKEDDDWARVNSRQGDEASLDHACAYENHASELRAILANRSES